MGDVNDLPSFERLMNVLCVNHLAKYFDVSAYKLDNLKYTCSGVIPVGNVTIEFNKSILIDYLVSFYIFFPRILFKTS